MTEDRPAYGVSPLEGLLDTLASETARRAYLERCFGLAAPPPRPDQRRKPLAIPRQPHPAADGSPGYVAGDWATSPAVMVHFSYEPRTATVEIHDLPPREPPPDAGAYARDALERLEAAILRQWYDAGARAADDAAGVIDAEYRVVE